jgi:hypothetical protein
MLLGYSCYPIKYKLTFLDKILGKFCTFQKLKVTKANHKFLGVLQSAYSEAESFDVKTSHTKYCGDQQ